MIFPDGSSFVNTFSNASAPVNPENPTGSMYPQMQSVTEQPAFYAEEYDDDLLNDGAIAGVAIGSVAGAGALVGAGMLARKKFKARSIKNRQMRALQQEQSGIGEHVSDAGTVHLGIPSTPSIGAVASDEAGGYGSRTTPRASDSKDPYVPVESPRDVSGGGYGRGDAAPIQLLRLESPAPPSAALSERPALDGEITDPYDPRFIKRMETETEGHVPRLESPRVITPLFVDSEVVAKTAFENLRQQKKSLVGDPKAAARARADLKKQMKKETDKQLTDFVARGKASFMDADEQAARQEVFRLAKEISEIKKNDPDRDEKLRNLTADFGNALIPLNDSLEHVGALREKRVVLKAQERDFSVTDAVKHSASKQKVVDKTAAYARDLHKKAPKPGWFGRKQAR